MCRGPEHRNHGFGREQARTRELFVRPAGTYSMRAQPAIDHALAHPDLSTVVIGAASLMQLDEALATLETGPLPGSALAEVERCYGGRP